MIRRESAADGESAAPPYAWWRVENRPAPRGLRPFPQIRGLIRPPIVATFAKPGGSVLWTGRAVTGYTRSLRGSGRRHCSIGRARRRAVWRRLEANQARSGYGLRSVYWARRCRSSIRRDAWPSSPNGWERRRRSRMCVTGPAPVPGPQSTYFSGTAIGAERAGARSCADFVVLA